MIVGTVKFFDSGRGFGFIQPESGGADVLRSHLCGGARRSVGARQGPKSSIRHRERQQEWEGCCAEPSDCLGLNTRYPDGRSDPQPTRGQRYSEQLG